MGRSQRPHVCWRNKAAPGRNTSTYHINGKTINVEARYYDLITFRDAQGQTYSYPLGVTQENVLHTVDAGRAAKEFAKKPQYIKDNNKGFIFIDEEHPMDPYYREKYKHTGFTCGGMYSSDPITIHARYSPKEFADTVCHEIGHHIYYRQDLESMYEKAIAKDPNGEYPTRYSKSATTEDFAESIKLLCTSKEKALKFKTDFPNRFQFIKDNVHGFVDLSEAKETPVTIAKRKIRKGRGQTEASPTSREDNYRLFEIADKDKEYTDVFFDEKTGGMKATHIYHGKEKKGKEYDRYFDEQLTGLQLEIECQNEIVRLGSSCILRREGVKEGQYKISELDSIIDGHITDIKSVTSNSTTYRNQITEKNEQIERFKKSHPGEIADTLCLYFHDPSFFSMEKLKLGIEAAKNNKDRKTGKPVNVNFATYCSENVA